MPTVEEAENFLVERLWDGEFEWSADVKAAAGERRIPPKLLWLAQEPRGCVPLDAIDIRFPQAHRLAARPHLAIRDQIRHGRSSRRGRRVIR
jgi:hypothetical protein